MIACGFPWQVQLLQCSDCPTQGILVKGCVCWLGFFPCAVIGLDGVVMEVEVDSKMTGSGIKGF